MKPLVTSVLILAAAVAHAEPALLWHSGYLLGANDLPITNPGITMRFRVVDAASGGAAVWQSAACSVAVQDGYYAVALGDASCDGTPELDTAHLAPGDPRWLEVTVDSIVLSPLVALAAPPSALVAARSLDTDTLRAELASATGSVNDAGNPVHWNQLVGVPEELADGTDDGATYAAAPGGGLALAGGAFSVAPGGVLNTMLANSTITVSTSGGLTGGGTIALGGTLNLGFSGGAVGDATSIRGVDVDDASKADGYVLRYDAVNDKVIYSPILNAPPPQPTVPATTSWSSDTETGNSKCAQAKGLCTQAWDASNNPQACGTQLGNGSAACTTSATINESVTWASDTETGDSMCASKLATCVQAYSDLGVAYSCATQLGIGTAACLKAPSTQGFDEYATWSGSVAFSGDAKCAARGAVCVTAFDSTGVVTACTTTGTSGRARCRKAVRATDGWDLGITWDPVNGSGTTGGMECAKQDAVCTAQWCTTNGQQYACDASFTSCGGIARCRRRDATDAWDDTITWATNSNTTGRMECSKRDQECVTQFCSTNGLEYSCDTYFTSCGGVARCRDREPSDPWTSIAQWAPNMNSTGDTECARAGAVCLSQYCTTNGSPYSCDTAFTSCGGLARCRPRTGSEPVVTVIDWPTNSNTTGRIECAKIGKECVSQVCSTNGGTYGCDSYFTSCGGRARCREVQPADSWTTAISWAPSSNTSARVECTKQGAECVDVYCSTDGGARTCDTHFTSCGGLARCRPRTASDTWDTVATFPANSNKTPRIACTELDAECVTSYCTTDSQTRSCDTVFTSCGGVVRCQKKLATDTWNKAIKWVAQDATGDAKCASIGGVCVEAYILSDGTGRSCATTFGAANGGIARCRL